MDLTKVITTKRIETLSIIVFSIIALLRGEITVFYMLYLFWWQSFIHVFVNIGKAITQKSSQTFPPGLWHYIGSNIFLLFIYVIFIIVLFGFVLNFKNKDLILINFEVLFFNNWSFNLNLIIIFVSSLFTIKYKPEVINSSMGGFSRKNIILHVSIIMGVFIQFLILIKFDTVFTDDNLWGSILVITPFLLLRAIFDKAV